MARTAGVFRETKETRIRIDLNLDGTGRADIATGIPFFDHMLTAMAVHGHLDLTLEVRGDLEVDFHHTVEDTGLVLGQALSEALNAEKDTHIVRFGDACVPMDESLSRVTVDLSNRPYLVYRYPETLRAGTEFSIHLAREFFQALSVQGAFNLHINTEYGANEHHALESIFKALGRALHAATRLNREPGQVLSTKGSL